MSRIIVKNLPNQVTEKKLKELFSTKGVVTDVQLKYTSTGKFRNFGFIGFQTDEQAEAARQAFDKSFFNASQIQIDLCTSLDDPNRPKPWKQKQLKVSVENADKIPKKSKDKAKDGNPIKDAEVAQLLESHQDDELFTEFMEAHLPDKKEVWQKTNKETDEDIEKEADKKISDKEYLKSKIKKDEENISNVSILTSNRFQIKLSNLPYKVKKSEIKEFLKPAKPLSIRLPVKLKGIAYCDFDSKEQLKSVLMKNRSFMASKRIYLKEYQSNKEEKRKWKQQGDKMADAETIAESGRLFVRNLAYVVLEDDLKQLFEKFGPIAEIILPIDPLSRKVKGYAFVTFVIPEHACKAFNELDGTIFLGRMLHLMPGRPKIEATDDDDDTNLTFAEKKAKKLKNLAKTSVNWNTFFINENCLVEAMADTYNTSKEKVLSDEGSGAAVRLALGETQMVQKTKDFLVQNGVLLEAFENMSIASRSNTVILAKNLPHGTNVSELRDKFSPFGELSRVLLSPFGGTAIIEYIESFEAQKAYKRLAYSRFKHIPLYLEWAPKNIFEGKKKLDEEKLDVKEKVEETKKVESSIVPAEGTTLYVKGINFSTGSENLRKHFETCGPVVSAIVAEKRDPQNPSKKLSMGYGFVVFADVESADNALKTLQFSKLDDHTIELKRSHRTVKEQTDGRTKPKGKPSTKIVVRNLPFQATQKEVRDLFHVFGEIKSLRLPKKMVGTGTHRGFCFVEFQSIPDAKRAFKALCESTHLYGRRLVLEWAETDDNDVDILRKKTAQLYRGEPKKRKIEIEDLPEEEDA